MAQQRLDLGVDVVGDVDVVVQLRTGHHPHFGHCVRLETFALQQRGEGELVAGIGIHRSEGGLARRQMVGVTCVDAVEVSDRRLAEHEVGFDLTNDSAQGLSQVEVGHDPAIGVAEEVELVDTEDLRGGRLLTATDFGHVGAADRVVEPTGVTVGDETVDDLVAGGDEACRRARGPEVEVVGVGGNGEDTSSHFHKLPIARHDGPMANMSKTEREEFLAQPHVGVISIEADGRAPVTVPIWYSYEPGGQVKVLTGVNSRKTQLLEAAGRFSLCVQRERLPYKYVSVEGPIVESRPAARETDSRPMAHRYLGASMGDMYIEDGDGDSTCFLMQPKRWSSVDYGDESSG